MEVEIIKEWLHDGNSEELIKEALKEAIYNNARNLKYIDRILFNWRTKGIKSKKSRGLGRKMVMISSSILKQDKGLMSLKAAPSRKTPPGNAVRDF